MFNRPIIEVQNQQQQLTNQLTKTSYYGVLGGSLFIFSLYSLIENATNHQVFAYTINVIVPVVVIGAELGIISTLRRLRGNPNLR